MGKNVCEALEETEVPRRVLTDLFQEPKGNGEELRGVGFLKGHEPAPGHVFGCQRRQWVLQSCLLEILSIENKKATMFFT